LDTEYEHSPIPVTAFTEEVKTTEPLAFTTASIQPETVRAEAPKLNANCPRKACIGSAAGAGSCTLCTPGGLPPPTQTTADNPCDPVTSCTVRLNSLEQTVKAACSSCVGPGSLSATNLRPPPTSQNAFSSARVAASRSRKSTPITVVAPLSKSLRTTSRPMPPAAPCTTAFEPLLVLTARSRQAIMRRGGWAGTAAGDRSCRGSCQRSSIIPNAMMMLSGPWREVQLTVLLTQRQAGVIAWPVGRAAVTSGQPWRGAPSTQRARGQRRGKGRRGPGGCRHARARARGAGHTRLVP
jgi:hypothetical protein